MVIERSSERELLASVLDAYELGEELGRGGWGIVYAATHRLLGRQVAVKVLPRAFAADPDVQERFREEARLAAQLNHLHVVAVYDCIQQGNLLLFVMERMQRKTLWDRFVEEGVVADETCAVVLAVCSALEIAHRTGRIHRDIKPENVLFDFRQVPKLSDFGVAKIVGYGRGQTRVGEVVGTPAYMSPEQASGQEVGPASDVYSLAVLAYELLAGRLPFLDTGDAVAQLYQHVHEAPPPLGEVAPSVSPGIAAAVMKGLAKSPLERYGSADAFAIAVARAATETFGPDWLRDSGLVVQPTERVANTIAAIAFQPQARRLPTVSRASADGARHTRIGTAADGLALAGTAAGGDPDVVGFAQAAPPVAVVPPSPQQAGAQTVAPFGNAAAYAPPSWPSPPTAGEPVPVPVPPTAPQAGPAPPPVAPAPVPPGSHGSVVPPATPVPPPSSPAPNSLGPVAGPPPEPVAQSPSAGAVDWQPPGHRRLEPFRPSRPSLVARITRFLGRAALVGVVTGVLVALWLFAR